MVRNINDAAHLVRETSHDNKIRRKRAKTHPSTSSGTNFLKMKSGPEALEGLCGSACGFLFSPAFMRILFLTSRFPYPLEKGDKLRAYHQIRELSARHEIILASVSDCKVESAHLEALKPYCRKIVVYEISRSRTLLNLLTTLFTGRPFQVGYFYSRRFHGKIRALVAGEKPSHIFCQLVRMAEYARHETGCVKVLDYMDAFSKGYERLSSRLSWLKRALVRMEWKRLLRYEQAVFSDFDRQVIISEQDRDL